MIPPIMIGSAIALTTMSALSCHTQATQNHPVRPNRDTTWSTILGTSSTLRQETATIIRTVAVHFTYHVVSLYGVCLSTSLICLHNLDDFFAINISCFEPYKSFLFQLIESTLTTKKDSSVTCYVVDAGY